LQIFIQKPGPDFDKPKLADAPGDVVFGQTENGHWFDYSELIDILGSVPWSATGIVPIYNKWVGVAGTAAYIPKTHTLCIGAGVGATEGHNVSFGPLPLGNLPNAENILKG
jgi:hypothetical protein